jgi:hypothetical protein
MKRALIKHLHAVAEQRRDGYLEACMRAGKISPDGQWVIFNDEAHTKLRLQYNPDPPLPTFGKMASEALKTAGRTLLRAVKGDNLMRSFWAAKRVESICRECEFFRHTDARCSKCGCRGKGGKLTSMWENAAKHCPLKPPKW